jgi:ketosteroid isomerase-like protein
MNVRADDREAIRDVLHRYCRAIDRRDHELLTSCYFEDSIDQRAIFSGSGPEFSAYAMKTVAKALFTHHVISNVLMEFDGEQAFVESYVHAIHRMDQGGKLVDFLHYGRYCDMFERRATEWKIAYRLHLPDADSIVDVEEPAGRSVRQEKQASEDHYVRGVPGPKDPSYLKFGIPQLKRDVAPVTDMFEKRLANRRDG